MLTDAQGSTYAVLDDYGMRVNADARMSFDPYGRRRSTTDWFTQKPWSGALGESLKKTTRRGYTGHEQVDGVGIIHMGALVNGETFRGLLVKDEASGYALAVDIARSFNANEVKATLLRLFRRYGVPRFLRSDNGPEFIAKVLKEWLVERGTETAYIEPGKPWQNGSSESFNGTFRSEVLDAEVFYSLNEARIISGGWRRLCNQRRPHSSNKYRPPNTTYHFKAGKKAAS